MALFQNMGKVEKLKITAYDDETFDEGKKASKVTEFSVLANPGKYSITYTVAHNKEQATGSSNSNSKFSRSIAPELSFDFIFDGTGVIEETGAKKESVIDQIEHFKKVVFSFEGDIHKSYHLKIAWGSLLFHGVLTSMDIEFKLFKPSGEPIRAVAKAKFVGTIDDNLRKNLEKVNSPDLTHVRIVRDGDTLPIMAERIYGDSKYYLEVAKVNNLINFRNLEAGQEIFFPPIEKTS